MGIIIYLQSAVSRNLKQQNYKEMEIAYNEPNEETLAAMDEAVSGAELETLDVDNFKDYVRIRLDSHSELFK